LGLFLCLCRAVLLLWLCDILWSQVSWYFQHCSFCSVLPWLFTAFCAFIWTLGLTFQSLWEMSLEYWCDFIEHIDSYSHFHDTNSANPWAWKSFHLLVPSSISSMIYIVFIVQVFHFLCIFWHYYYWNSFPKFFLSLFIIGI
jgi:hypothetical protein